MSEVTTSGLTLAEMLVHAATYGNMVGVQYALENGADIDASDKETGLAALHAAIGMNHIEVVRHLLECGAKVVPDRRGRWPSTIAELMEVDGDLCDLIANAEKTAGDV